MLQKNSKNPVDSQKDKRVNPKSFWKHPRALATKHYCTSKKDFLDMSRDISVLKNKYMKVFCQERGGEVDQSGGGAKT